MADKPDMAALQNDLDRAIEVKRNADTVERAARNRVTDALNSLNAAQKAFDGGVDAIRAEAAKAGGDWRTKAGV